MNTTSFSLSHIEFRKNLQKFIAETVEPYVLGTKSDQAIDVKEIIYWLGERQFLCQHGDSAFGGHGNDIWYQVILHEELARLSRGAVGMSVLSHLDIATSLLLATGSDIIKTTWGKAALNGEKVLALALTEENVGSDLANVTATAKRTNNGYLISGKKMYITNGHCADGYCLLAQTEKPTPFGRTTLFFVPRTENVFSSLLKPLGNNGDFAEIEFRSVIIPESYRLGEEGQGLLLQMRQFVKERVFIAVRMYSMNEYYLRLTIEHCKKRKTFGKQLIFNQSIQFELVQLLVETEQLKQLTYQCISALTEGKEEMMYAAMAKLTGNKLIRKTADVCLQYFGGVGYLEDHPIGHYYRDAQGLALAGGTDEMLQKLIAKYL